MDIEKSFLKTIQKYELLKKREKILIGVSGGPDSVCMLHLFCALREEYKFDLVCAHFNHCLRKEADIEEKFVKSICRELKIKCVSEKKNVGKFFKGDSLEQTARNLRFDFFLKCSREFRSKKIALAHNKDDVAETVLMRIIRGTARRGLRGILPKSKIKGVTFIRPLLEIRKEDILKWLKFNEYTYKIDTSNFDEVFLRNKIRQKLLPFLKEFNPNMVNALFNLSRIAALDYECIEEVARNQFSHLKKRQGRGYVKLSIEGLKKLHPSFIFNLVRLAIEELKGNTRKLELRHLEEIGDLLYNRPGGSIVDIPDLKVEKDDSWLIIKSLLF